MKFTSVLKILSLVCVVAFMSCGDDDDPREKFIGNYSATLSGCSIEVPVIGLYPIPDLPMTMTFTNSSDEDVIDISVASTFFATTTTTGEVSGNNITIAPFDIEIAAGPSTIPMTLSGPGTYQNETTIDVDLNIKSGTAETNCDLELTKS